MVYKSVLVFVLGLLFSWCSGATVGKARSPCVTTCILSYMTFDVYRTKEVRRCITSMILFHDDTTNIMASVNEVVKETLPD